MLDAGSSLPPQTQRNHTSAAKSSCNDYDYDYNHNPTDTDTDTNTESDQMGLSTLPYDLLLNIATYLDLRDVHALHLTCKSLYDASTTRPVYRKLATDLLRRCRALPLKGFQRLADLNTEALVHAVNKATHYEAAWRVRAPRPIRRELYDAGTGVNRRSNYMDVAPRGRLALTGARAGGKPRSALGGPSESPTPTPIRYFKWYKIVSAPPGEEVDWLSPITSSYTLCATKSGKVVCWDVQTDTCLAEWNPGARWELWKCRVEFEERTVFFTMAKVLAGSYDDDRIMQFVLMRLTFSDGPSGESAPAPPVFSHVTEFRTTGVVMNVFLLDPAERLLSAFIWVSTSNTIGLYALPDWERREYVFVDTGIECVMSSNWSCILYQNHIVIHCEESDAAYQHFYPLALLKTYITTLPDGDPTGHGMGSTPTPVISRRLPPVRTLKKKFVFPLLRGVVVESDEEEEEGEDGESDDEDGADLDLDLEADLDLDLDLEAEMQSTIHAAYLVQPDAEDGDRDSFMANGSSSTTNGGGNGGGIRILNGNIHDTHIHNGNGVSGPSTHTDSSPSSSSSSSSSSLLSLSQPSSSSSPSLSSSSQSQSSALTTLPPAPPPAPATQFLSVPAPPPLPPPYIAAPITIPFPSTTPAPSLAPAPAPTPTPNPNPFPFPPWYPESAHFVRQWWPSLPSIPRVSCTVVLLAAHDQTTHRTRFVLAQHYFRVPLDRREWEAGEGEARAVGGGKAMGGMEVDTGLVNGKAIGANGNGKTSVNGVEGTKAPTTTTANGHIPHVNAPYLNGTGVHTPPLTTTTTTAAEDADADAQDDALMNLWYVSKPFEVVRVFDNPAPAEEDDGGGAGADAANPEHDPDPDPEGGDDGVGGGSNNAGAGGTGGGAAQPQQPQPQAQPQDDDDGTVGERPRPLVAVDFGHAVWIEYVDSGDAEGEVEGLREDGDGDGDGEDAEDGDGDGDERGDNLKESGSRRTEVEVMRERERANRRMDVDRYGHEHRHGDADADNDDDDDDAGGRASASSDSDSDMAHDPDAKWLRFVTFPPYSEELGLGSEDGDDEEEEEDVDFELDPIIGKGKGKGKGKDGMRQRGKQKGSQRQKQRGKGKQKQKQRGRGRGRGREREGVVRTLATPPGLDLGTVETINIDQSQGAVILSDKGGRIWILCYE